MKKFAKRIMAATPCRIVRDNGANRFEAIETSLRSMKSRGFEPSVVIDGGAHIGTFSLLAKNLFPDARYQLIEPQPCCAGPLLKLCAREGWSLHACAISDRVGTAGLRLTQEFDTGAHLTTDRHDQKIRTDTLDNMFSDTLKTERVLLKLCRGMSLARSAEPRECSPVLMWF
jgi:FkbM family methyltransferase